MATRKARVNSRMLFQLTLRQLGELFSEAQKSVRLAENYILYQLRHAGPSHDRAEKLRPLDEVRKRGRWQAHSSVSRYEKSGLLNQAAKMYRPGFLEHAVECDTRLEEVMLGTTLPIIAKFGPATKK